MEINQKEDARRAYSYINLIEHGYGFGDDFLIDFKRAVRKYSHRDVEKRVIILDKGINGYIEKIRMPEWIISEDDAENYFLEHYFMIFPYTFGCTGRPFTYNYTIVRRKNGIYVYHEVVVDC